MSAETKPQSYVAAAIPEPFQILGLHLKPFCLGHLLLIERFNVAFVTEETFTLKDLVVSVLICHMTFEEGCHFFETSNWIEMVSKWGEGCGAFDLAEKVELFKRYVSAALQQPVVIYEGEVRKTGSHPAQTVIATLTAAGGRSFTEAVNMPMAQAFADFYKIAENEGLITIMDDGTRELMETVQGGGTFQTPGFDLPEVEPGPSELGKYQKLFNDARARCQT